MSCSITRSCVFASALLSLFGVGSAAAFAANSFVAMEGMTQGSAVSSDGQVIVGVASSGANRSAYWTRAGGMQIVPGTPNTLGGGSANGVSADGTWIVGSVRIPQNTSGGFGLAAYRWSAATGMEVIPDQPGGSSPVSYYAQSVSSDGNAVAGYGDITSTLRAFVHRHSTGQTQTSPTFASSYPYSTINHGLSADGSVLVGGAKSGDGFVAFRSSAAGLQRLPGMNPGTVALPFQDYASDVSDDGRFSTGWSVEGSLNTPTFRAMLWDGLTARVLSNTVAARAYAVSGTGNVVVGTLGSGDSEAMIWTERSGVRDLRSFLANDLGMAASLSGWTLSKATSISADGSVITGWGNRNGQMIGFVAVIPEPSCLAVLAALHVGTRLRRRRQD